jgi:hypothetical protein
LTDTGCPGDGTDSTVVAEYIFNEGSGSNAFNTGTDDEGGDGVLTNGVSFSTNVPLVPAVGYSVNFPSSGSGSSTPAIQSYASYYDPLTNCSRFSLMAWVKRESSSSNNNTSARIISDTSSTSLTNTTAGFEFRFSGSGGSLAFRVNGKEVSMSDGAIPPNEGNWHHVAVVYDGSRPATNPSTRNVHFYVDGIQRGDGSTLTNEVVSANTNRLTVGNSSVGRSVGNAFVGKLDDVRILRQYAFEPVGNAQMHSGIECHMVQIMDEVDPTISCPPDITTNADLGHCYASNIDLGGSYDQRRHRRCYSGKQCANRLPGRADSGDMDGV